MDRPELHMKSHFRYGLSTSTANKRIMAKTKPPNEVTVKIRVKRTVLYNAYVDDHRQVGVEVVTKLCTEAAQLLLNEAMAAANNNIEKLRKTVSLSMGESTVC